MVVAKDGEGTQKVGFACTDLLYYNDEDCSCSFRATRVPLPTAEDVARVTYVMNSAVPSDAAAHADLDCME
eukprot:6628049-Lingulodinium_polyedra.AAC.1